MLVDFNKQVKLINDIKSGKICEGLSLGVPEIDEYYRYKNGNFNIVLGHANVGKTTFILYLMLCYTVKHNLKWLICSTENESYSLIRKLLEFMEEQPLKNIEQEQMKTSLAYINSHFKFVDNTVMYDYKEAIVMFREEKKHFNYNGILLDPYNALTKDYEMMKSIGGHEYDYQACTELRMLCKELNVGMILNTHANTNALRMVHRNEHTFAGHPMPPMASDVEGGGKFVNRADDFIVVHRYTLHPRLYTTTMVHIRKIKEIETGGRPTSIDNPIEFKALQENVGFSINGKSVLRTIKESQLNFL